MDARQDTGGLRNVRLLINGSELVEAPEAIARVFADGDRLIALPGPEFLHIPRAHSVLAASAVDQAAHAFTELARISQDAVTRFYGRFADALSSPKVWDPIEAANEEDARATEEAGRSTTRLVLSEKMRAGMIAGLNEWRDRPSPVNRVMETTDHEGWSVDHVLSPLGVVAFVFEGRPNVFADATGVLRSGNTAVMRIGRDALGTARAIMRHALVPSLEAAGLPRGAVTLIDSREHSAGWALFSDTRLALAIARGSGAATRQLGAVARQAGIPVSLHGTGGAWMVAAADADPNRFHDTVFHSLDRKVCNTLNTVCLIESAAGRLAPALLKALQARQEQNGVGYRLHVTAKTAFYLPEELFSTPMQVFRADGISAEMAATTLAEDDLGREWEWEKTPEISVTTAADLNESIDLFNRFSPQFIASLISEDQAAQDAFFAGVNAPFVGDGFTRWVDGQYALNRPELGLSNWQNGRLLGRGGILSGDGIYTIRLRVRQTDAAAQR